MGASLPLRTLVDIVEGEPADQEGGEGSVAFHNVVYQLCR